MTAIHVDRSWLVLTCENTTIRLDARFLDRVLADDSQLILSVGEARASLDIPVDVLSASQISALLVPYTRSAQITLEEVYKDAKRRLELASRNRRDNGAFALYVGSDDVFVDDRYLRVGKFKCLLVDVALYAQAEACLPLPTCELDARLAMLVVAARDRVEDLELLATRVAQYESRLRSGADCD